MLGRVCASSRVRFLGSRWRMTSASAPLTTLIDATGADAVVFGGFGFGRRQMEKHEALYQEHGFSVTPVLASPFELSSPGFCSKRGKELAEKLMMQDKDIVCHAISGSVWTLVYMLAAMDPAWRDQRVKAIAFDSSPPKSDVHAFGGWLSFATQKPFMRNLAPLFEPYRMYQGIDARWEAENHGRMFGPAAVIPRGAHCLFMRGRNDPVLNADYVDSFIADVKAHAGPNTNIQEVLFEKARHAMAIVESPDEYKAVHVDSLLAMVPEWRADGSAAAAEYVVGTTHAVQEFS
jgi:hypothetical protein